YAEAVSVGDVATADRVLWEMSLRDDPSGDENAPDAVIAALCTALRSRGYRVRLAVGQSAFRCDLAVFREGDPSYRLGVLVDTDDYYQHANILERDVLRPSLLRAFGWKVAHVL